MQQVARVKCPVCDSPTHGLKYMLGGKWHIPKEEPKHCVKCKRTFDASECTPYDKGGSRK